MSKHTLPQGVNLKLLRILLRSGLREPDRVELGPNMSDPPSAIVFDKDLTTQEKKTLEKILGKAEKMKRSKDGESLSPAEANEVIGALVELLEG